MRQSIVLAGVTGLDGGYCAQLAFDQLDAIVLVEHPVVDHLMVRVHTQSKDLSPLTGRPIAYTELT